MNKMLYILAFTLFFTSCQKQKIGFVDNCILVNESQQKKDIEAKFQLKKDAFKIKTDSIGKIFQKEVLADQANAQKLYKQNRIDKAEVIITNLQQKQQKLQQELQIEQQLLTKEFQNEIDSVITTVKTFVKSYGENNGYTYILGTSDATSTVMYGVEANNITKPVLEALNSAYSK